MLTAFEIILTPTTGANMGLNYLVPLLSGLRYQQYYTPLAKIVKSVNAAIIFSELMQRFDYHRTKNELTTLDNIEGWFYHTSEAMDDRLALSRREQDTGIKILKDFELIETRLSGIPAKRYFKINIEKFVELMEISKNIYSLAETANQGSTIMPNNSCGNRQQYKDKEPKEEPKKEIRAVASSLSITKKEKKDFGEFVKLSENEFKDLCQELGCPLVQHYITAINLWVPNNKPKKNYAATIKQWHHRDKSNGNLPKIKTLEAEEISIEEIEKRRVIAKQQIKKYWELAVQKDIELSDNVNFIKIGNDSIYLNDKKFYEFLKHAINKHFASTKIQPPLA